MPKKRKSGGKRQGKKGRVRKVQCCSCGAMIPTTKAKKVYRWVSIVDSRLAQELRKKHVYMPKRRVIKYYCISCGVHRHLYSPRQEKNRKKPYKKK